MYIQYIILYFSLVSFLEIRDCHLRRNRRVWNNIIRHTFLNVVQSAVFLFTVNKADNLERRESNPFPRSRSPALFSQIAYHSRIYFVVLSRLLCSNSNFSLSCIVYTVAQFIILSRVTRQNNEHCNAHLLTANDKNYYTIFAYSIYIIIIVNVSKERNQSMWLVIINITTINIICK